MAPRVLVGALAILLVAVPAQAFAAGPEGGLDRRGWELVSPADGGGAEGVGRPDDAGAGVFMAATAGGALAFGSEASFVAGAGAPPVSQYLAQRGGGGWATTNVSPPLLAGTYPGGAFQLFSTDLSRSLLSNGWGCREGGDACAAQNPSLDAAAPPGYRTLYLREGSAYDSLLTLANSPALTIAPEDFRLALVGATPDLDHAIVATCAKLTANAVEVSGPAGCDPAATNLYEWSGGTLAALNLLPGQPLTTPGASLAAATGAVSADGSRVYWRQGGDLYLREGLATKAVAAGAEFQAASGDGSVAFYTAAGHLYRFDALSGASTDLTPGGGVQGVLGASATGADVYYLASSGLFLWHGGAATKVAAAADSSNLPAASGTARVSADGSRLAFLSAASLTGYPNAGKAEVYLYESPSGRLLCVSCNPKGTAPIGPSTIPAARAAAEGPSAYKPRALSADGRRLFFDSADALAAADTDGLPDVYEWEAQGSGTCAAAAGCLALVSNGRSGADSFLDASADGTDAFFLTSVSLVATDRGGLDAYDARVDGGFAETAPVVPCEGDSCQGPILLPDDLAPATAGAKGLLNPAPSFVKVGKPATKKKKHKKKHRAKHRTRQRGGR